ncbi:MAG: DUF1579 family protein, partial [Planctomycetota bacterium]|nr:DUF1579 family protein [Planctomycetota bacterium]
YEWAVEGKWLLGRDEGMMMETPWKWTYFLGYDNFKKKFVGASITSMSTMLLTYEGGLDQTGTELMMWGPMDEPTTGEHDKPVRYHWKFEGKDKISIEVHDLMIGGNHTKVIQVDYVRKKAE